KIGQKPIAIQLSMVSFWLSLAKTRFISIFNNLLHHSFNQCFQIKIRSPYRESINYVEGENMMLGGLRVGRRFVSAVVGLVEYPTTVVKTDCKRDRFALDRRERSAPIGGRVQEVF